MRITPFSISPLPGALYLTPSLKACLLKTNYVIDNRQGLALILGAPGMGKSSVLRRLEGDLSASPDIKLAFLPDPETSSTYSFTRNLCGHFEIPAKRSLDRQKEAFRDYVFAQAQEGYNVVVLLDEAQALNNEMLETLRSFLNFESNKAKLVQIIMAGQLELRAKLKANQPMRSRIIMYSLLDPLSAEEMRAMLHHRCELNGLPLPFTPVGLARIYEWSGGVPRDALRLCASSYELAKLYELAMVSLELIEAAISQEERVFAEEDTPDEQVVANAAS